MPIDIFHKIAVPDPIPLENNYIDRVDFRLQVDNDNIASIPELIEFLSEVSFKEKIKLSIGVTTATEENPENKAYNEEFGIKLIELWSKAQECGFEIPSDFITGPWCIAIAKHSAVLQPDGELHKCFCTSGNHDMKFSHLNETQTGTYLKDERFEQFRRTDECISEQCTFLPVCGAGCIHESFIEDGEEGFGKRFCQKSLIGVMNRGLLILNHDSL